jgi:hypothetical protein
MRRLEAKLDPVHIRATLEFAGLYQITHELIKELVLDRVREFYWCGFRDGRHIYDEQRYAKNVLARAPKNRFRASLLWLVDLNVITLKQADRLEEIYAFRHELTHELLKYIVDPGFEIDVQLFLDALSILGALSRFWTEVEIDIGSFEHLGKVDPDEAVWAPLFVLQLCIEAYTDGLRSS